MSNIDIDTLALREAAERAIPAMERLLMLPVDDDLISEQELKDYGVDIDALNAFKFLAGPETVLALLDERERNQQYIKRRDQENEDIALTVGKLLIENGRLVADTLRHLADNEIDSDYFAITSTNENGTEIDHEMAITDYALQAAGTVDELVAALEAAEKRIAELEKSEEQLINERDHAESALADMYFAATGDRPEWSNWFGFSDAVDAVVDRIADLEAKQCIEEMSKQSCEARERDLFESWVMHSICISKSTLEGLRTETGYRNATLSGTDFNRMWEQWKSIRAAGIRIKGE
ncbi:TPA: ead/Ea22-like family protein [Escherichia coli]